MLKVGLTGGIGSGKSSVSKLFSSLGITIVDADKISKDVVAPGQPALDELVAHFGNDILELSGQLDRKQLRKRVFSNAQELAWLNRCLHPKIRESMLNKAEDSSGPYVIFDIPLLFENKLETLVDKIIVVDIPVHTQIARVMKRDNVEMQDVEAIIQQQVTRDYRLAHADYIIDNTATVDKLEPQVKALDRLFRKGVEHGSS